MPTWATDLGVKGQLLVPKESLKSISNQNSWENVDWWLAIFLLLEGWHERLWEKTKGVIHSYSFLLKGWDSRAWEHAWVNRIAIFLRRWSARQSPCNEDLMGTLPKTKLVLSHDVDAVAKTLPIRLKQGGFNLFNALKYSLRGSIPDAANYFRKALTMTFGKADWNKFDELITMESKAGVSAEYNFYADNRRKTLKRWFFDPSYVISSDKLKALLLRLKNEGYKIGLHPSFDSWNNSDLIANQRKVLEKYSNITISSCRQHWLRFSWADTWSVQSSVGIKEDSTLMFNDRPGFRNSAAINWKPWNPQTGKSHEIRCMASILMDSHLYDYRNFNDQTRKAEISKWVLECKETLSFAAILWHPHTLSEDYNWKNGFTEFLNQIQLTK